MLLDKDLRGSGGVTETVTQKSEWGLITKWAYGGISAFQGADKRLGVRMLGVTETVTERRDHFFFAALRISRTHCLTWVEK
jgi:hypothetical protein